MSISIFREIHILVYPLLRSTASKTPFAENTGQRCRNRASRIIIVWYVISIHSIQHLSAYQDSWIVDPWKPWHLICADVILPTIWMLDDRFHFYAITECGKTLSLYDIQTYDMSDRDTYHDLLSTRCCWFHKLEKKTRAELMRFNVKEKRRHGPAEVPAWFVPSLSPTSSVIRSISMYIQTANHSSFPILSIFYVL